tara:strand:- start:2460 stop:3284 length:825 start_codon:yes stop_codon:yes gene_type:complete
MSEYTNIAAGYRTGPGAKAEFNLGSWNRFTADHPSISKQQFKVMTQQLKHFNPGSYTRPQANAALQQNVLQGNPGMFSNANPFGRYQGPHGNFGAQSITNAFNAGALPMDNPGAIPGIVGQGGMFMPHGATQIWQNMMAGHQQQSQWEQMMANIPTAADIMAMMPQYQAPEPVGHGQAYSTAGGMMSGLQAATADKFDTEGGGSSTQHQFGKGQQYTGTMNIGQGGTEAATFGAEQNQAQMGWDKLKKQYDWKNLNTAGTAASNAAASLGINTA